MRDGLESTRRYKRSSKRVHGNWQIAGSDVYIQPMPSAICQILANDRTSSVEERLHVCSVKTTVQQGQTKKRLKIKKKVF